MCFLFFFFQAEDGIRDLVRSRGLGDLYKRQSLDNYNVTSLHPIQLTRRSRYSVTPSRVAHSLQRAARVTVTHSRTFTVPSSDGDSWETIHRRPEGRHAKGMAGHMTSTT